MAPPLACLSCFSMELCIIYLPWAWLLLYEDCFLLLCFSNPSKYITISIFFISVTQFNIFMRCSTVQNRFCMQNAWGWGPAPPVPAYVTLDGWIALTSLCLHFLSANRDHNFIYFTRLGGESNNVCLKFAGHTLSVPECQLWSLLFLLLFSPPLVNWVSWVLSVHHSLVNSKHNISCVYFYFF